MHCILYKIYFWEGFSYVLQIDMHFICTLMWTKFILVKSGCYTGTSSCHRGGPQRCSTPGVGCSRPYRRFPVHLSPWVQDPEALGPPDPKRPPRARNRWLLCSRDPKQPPGVGTRWLCGPRDPRWVPSTRTPLGVQGPGRTPRAWTRLPPCFLALL
jgi:hypothetical protein